MHRLDTSISFVALVLAIGTTACSAPYRSAYGASGGITYARPLNGRSGEKADYAMHLSFAPVEFGAVKGGARPGWSVTAYPLDIDAFGSAVVPSLLQGNQRYHRFSAGAFGGRVYLLSHFVKGKRTGDDATLSPNSGLAAEMVMGAVNEVTTTKDSTVFYQVASMGAEVKIAPLAFGILERSGQAMFYDGFGEAALFANTSIPFRFGASLEVRGGAQWATATGGTLFVRLELAITGSRLREPTQDELNAEEDPVAEESPKWQ